MFFFSPLYLLFLVPALILTVYAQSKVKRTYGKYAKVDSSSGLTARQVAERILDHGAGSLGQPRLRDVAIESVEGRLGDHYDPRKKVLRLSNPDSKSLADIGVAAHEAGHALQDAARYQPLVIRSAVVPVASIGSNIAPWLIIGGIMLNVSGLALVGIIAFAAMVAFTLVTLPVEFNASSRAMQLLPQIGALSSKQEHQAVGKVLNAAALTYVAAAATAILQLAYFVLMFLGMRR